MIINIGDILTLKKKHPCGGADFAVLSVGSDVPVKCLRCGRVTVIPRVKLEKSIKSISKNSQTVTDKEDIENGSDSSNRNR